MYSLRYSIKYFYQIITLFSRFQLFLDFMSVILTVFSESNSTALAVCIGGLFQARSSYHFLYFGKCCVVYSGQMALNL